MAKEIYSINTQSEPHMELVLTHTHVLMRLSDEAVEEIQKQLDSEKENEEPFSWVQGIKNFVLNSVDKLIHKSIEYPLHDIESLNYEDGTLHFEYAREHLLRFDSVSLHDEDKSILQDFLPEEASLFVDKFRSAKERYSKFIEGSDGIENLPG